MHHKYHTQTLLQSFVAFVRTQFHTIIKTIRVDNGSEFLSKRDFFNTHGIEYQRTCVYTPQQNGVVERKHRHIITVARALLFQSNLPLPFWGECVLTAVYLINRLPSPLLSTKTPFEMLYNRPPCLDHLKVFGCLAYATVVHPTQKFDSRAHRCVLIGYPTGKKGYKLYNLETKKFLVSRDVKFSETIFPFSLAIPTNTSSSQPSIHMHNPDYHTPALHPASSVHESICPSPTEQVPPATTISPTFDHVNSTTPNTATTPTEPSPTDQDGIPDTLVPDHTSPTIHSPRRSTRSTKPPSWHKDYHLSN